MRRPAALLAAIAGVLALASPAAADSQGRATFLLATGGSTSVAVYPGALKIYSKSPAYIALKVNGSTSTLEGYGASHQFAAVAVRDRRRGNSGMDCFLDTNLVTGRNFVSDFVRGGVEYHGLLMRYSKFFFLRGTSKASACTAVKGSPPAVSFASLKASSPTLVFDCLVRSCRGNFVTFGRGPKCTGGSVSLPGGGRGCLPTFRGKFTMTGGLRLTFKLNLVGRAARSTSIVVIVNGKRIAFSRLTSLPSVPPTPPRPTKTSVSASCPGGSITNPVAISGSLRPGLRAPIVLSFTSPTGATSLLSATAGANGRYSASFKPTAAGAWTVTAGFNGDRSHRASTSAPCRFTVS
jgi:hypothetical protein